MSAITKLFIVLLVVCSLLLVSALVVFVNREEDYRKLYGAESDRRKQAEQLATEARISEQAARALIVANDLAHENRVALLNKDKDALAGERDRALSDATAQKKEKDAFMAQLKVSNDAITAATSALTLLEGQLAEARKTLTDTIAKNGQLDQVNTELSRSNAILIEQLRLMKEDLAQLRIENENLRKSAAVGVVLPGGAPNIAYPPSLRGVISEVREFNGQYWATITLGSVDRVERGMKFHVIDGANHMGILQVDSVEPNAAFGRLSGDKAKDVKRDMEVRTSLNAG